MANLTINKDLCNGCGVCINSCGNNAITLDNGKAIVNENCILCGICVDSCPCNAISIENISQPTKDISNSSGIWVFAEVSQGKLLPVGFELLGKGRALANQKKCSLTAVLLSHSSEAMAKELIYAGADDVLICADKDLHDLREELCTTILCNMIMARNPEILLFGATAFGRSVAPRVAARIQTGLTADCTMLEIDDKGLLRQTRPAFGGNIMATIICPKTRPQMATVRSGIMEPIHRDTTRIGKIVRVPFPSKLKTKTKIMETRLNKSTLNLADAKALIVVGKGIGSKKNMALVNQLADLIGASVGVSRPLVDAGWSEYKHQVGQTGATVAPKVLISLGVSGAIQHLAGIYRAEKIIAVNTDPDAPIFGVCHYKIVADCVEILKELIEIYKK
ncbi:MAG TPA: electron transfer flavoprotein subunit alpha [Lachnospiraceae bacterium]|nr:electron transfer flavoprotein subunit alpha [Lachnospiraceae bacterium]